MTAACMVCLYGEMSELAEGARLEIVCVVYSGTEGSNPSLSAITPRVCQVRSELPPKKIPAIDGHVKVADQTAL